MPLIFLFHSTNLIKHLSILTNWTFDKVILFSIIDFMDKDFFIINGYPLDEQQKNAILNASKYSLIVAGAGSGKTLTMIGKIKYLLEIKKIKPEEILCISFTNESVKSLKEKIKNDKIHAFTFHKLAIHILSLEEEYFEIAGDDFLKKTIYLFFRESLWSHSFLRKQFFKVSKKVFFSKKQYLTFLKTKNYFNIVKLLETFISLFSTNNLTIEDFKSFFTSSNNNPLLFLIYAILNFYETEKEKKNLYDFDDLIKKAMELCKSKNICNYKEIIIDEFQDTSKLRLDFIREVVKNSDANLTVVGDDFQSIYKFSGCDLNIFLNFQEYFKGAKTFKIENTYRNSQELIKVAGDFVMKNHLQIKKDLKSSKLLEHPIKIVWYLNPYKVLLKIIKEISSGEILILGRNNFDIYAFIPKEKITWLENGYFHLENFFYKLRYLTIHKSKGLESDNVILINLVDSEIGLPAKRKSHAITYLIQGKENFLYEEERRLFYVALTRTKNFCFLLVPYFHASIFIKEIKKEI